MKDDILGLAASAVLSLIYVHATNAFVVTPIDAISSISNNAVSFEDSESSSFTSCMFERPTVSALTSASALWAKKEKGQEKQVEQEGIRIRLGGFIFAEALRI
mmetsp:Transcript_42950/g.91316  ORF Transcript_42950/g.91316 Transcript_42950/m.91316 type:complete len:103 (-) Transcript_42950:250-558(-)